MIFRQHLPAFVCYSMSGNKCSEKPVSIPVGFVESKPSPGVMDGGGESQSGEKEGRRKEARRLATAC